MRNMVATIIVFGVIFILILGAAFFFQKMHGLDTLKSADEAIDRNVRSIVERAENFSAGHETEKESAAGSNDNTSDGLNGSFNENGENAFGDSEMKEKPTIESTISEDAGAPSENGTSDTGKKNPDPEKYEKGDETITPENASENGKTGFNEGFRLPESFKTAAEDAGESFRRFVEEDPFGKSVKNLGEVIKKDADNISKKLFDNSTSENER